MHLHFYNTEKRVKEIFSPQDERRVTLYTCGPTVYHYAHIGNFRTYLFEDLLKRTLKYFGFHVFHVMNITDVEDKTIQGAMEQGLALNEFTKPYKKAFFEDLETLRIEPADAYPQATDHVEQMIAIIQKLLEEGVAYRGQNGSIYYRIQEFSSYGRLSHLKLEELRKGASNRVNHDEYGKEEAFDFVLWKAYDEKRDGSVFWESSFGRGRPGWHVECSAMAIHLLGESIDIHCGGVDNIFPHHENEIAQSEAYTGKHFVRYWLHAEHLIVDGKKMSKSLGNFYTLRDLLDQGYSGEEVRFLLLGGHYRTQLNFTVQGLESARKSVKRIKECGVRLLHVQEGKAMGDLDSLVHEAKAAFERGLADDLNMPQALAALFDLIREVNTWLDEESLNKEQAALLFEEICSFNRILGLDLQELEVIPQPLTEALHRRDQARKEQNWAVADAMRQQIEEGGFVVVDTPDGSFLKPK